MLRLSKTRSYSVPVILHALDILELLSASEVPLKTNEIADFTHIPRSTTYRILRTFLERGYIYQNLEGQFGVQDSRLRKVVSITNGSATTFLNHALESETDMSADRVIEILLTVLQGLKHGHEGEIERKVVGNDHVTKLESH